MMYRSIPLLSTLFLSSLLLLTACGPAGSEQQSATAEKELPPAEEDEMLLHLSAYLSTDTSRAAVEQNAIIGYAIDNLIDVSATPSGLFYQVIEPGTGAPIAWGDYLVAHYRGYLLDGTVFGETYQRNQPLEFYVGNMIDAWNEGLALIRVGGKIRLLVPSRLGYGAEGLVSSTGRAVVAPHQILAFEVEVLEKKDPAE